jgi:hypothetical protein
MSAVHLLRVHRTTQTRLDLELALVVYIGWYNQRRLHRALPTRTYAERRTQGGLSKMEEDSADCTTRRPCGGRRPAAHGPGAAAP